MTSNPRDGKSLSGVQILGVDRPNNAADSVGKTDMSRFEPVSA
jgi:hypothetical protein